jgi:alpha-glucosidase
VHDVFRRWRALAEAYDPPRVLIGETWVFDLERLARFYGEDADELQLAFNMPFLLASFEPEPLAEIVANTEAALPAEAWPVWTLSNHDVIRFPTRWCADHPARVRCALLLLLTLRGTPVLYYGDELGMPQARLARSDLRDPVGLRHWPLDPGRDGARTPMAWTDEPGAGFTEPGVRPWLPIADAHAVNAAGQRDDPGSVLSLTRDLITLRRELDVLAVGSYERLDAPRGSWAWRRGERVVVALNACDEERSLERIRGRIRVATDRARDGEEVDGTLVLRPWEAVVLVAVE